MIQRHQWKQGCHRHQKESYNNRKHHHPFQSRLSIYHIETLFHFTQHVTIFVFRFLFRIRNYHKQQRGTGNQCTGNIKHKNIRHVERSHKHSPQSGTGYVADRIYYLINARNTKQLRFWSQQRNRGLHGRIMKSTADRSKGQQYIDMPYLHTIQIKEQCQHSRTKSHKGVG